jgi:dTDP-4-amino-4,6-dideoxygalactose transaminase
VSAGVAAYLLAVILAFVTEVRVSPHEASVPFCDLRTVHSELSRGVLEDVAALLERADFVNGAAVSEFEHAFSAYCGRRHGIGVASGLDALRLALLAVGIRPGDEVLVPAQTFAATFEAVTQTGGIPVVVDVSETDYTMEVEACEAAVGKRTRAVLPVHLYGQMADMHRLSAITERLDLALVEDACQAHGASRDGLLAGVRGNAACFSFYPTKNLGAIGDAGALVTDDTDVAERVRALREHGQTGKYEHELEGYTARLDTLQALVLLRKLPLLGRWNEQRRAAARFYDYALADVGDLRLPPVPPGSEPVWHLYVVRTADPTGLGRYLRERGIATGRHYPVPPHLSPAFDQLGLGPGTFPVAERLSLEALSLPIYPGIRDSQLAAVAEAIRDFFARG